MAFTFPAMVAWDPTGNLAVKNVQFQVYATSDTTFLTPLAILDSNGNPITGNILKSGAQGVFPQFQQTANSTVVVADAGRVYVWTLNCVPSDASTAAFINQTGSATQGALNATYAKLTKAGQSAIETQRSTALEPWFVALANRDNAPAKWMAFGDSITEGSTSSSNLKRWVQRSLDGLRNRYATSGLTGGGIGFLPSHYDSTSMGQPTSASVGTPTLNTDFGIGRRTAQMSGTQSYTYTLTCSSFDLWYVAGPSTGTIGVQIDGGTVTSVNTVGGSVLDGNTWNSGALTPGSHTVVITVVAGTTYFAGLSVYNGDESKGIRLYEAGHYGWTTSNWLANSNWWPRTVSTVQPHLVTIALGTNDINAGVAPATVAANINSLITSIRSQITAPPSIVLVAYPARTDITPTYPWQSYVDQMHTIAAADSLVSVLDLSVRMSNPNNTSLGTWNADKVHPTDKGHALIADTFVGFVSPR